MLSDERANQWRPFADIDDEAGRWKAIHVRSNCDIVVNERVSQS